MIILVVNCGSSSIKYQLLEMDTETVLAQGLLERIGQKDARLTQKINAHKHVIDCAVGDHQQGMTLIFETLTHKDHGPIRDIGEINGVGHRVVHGGEDFVASALIDDDVIKAITHNQELAPLHNPPNLTGIRAVMKLLPGVPNVAVFDTSFHQTIPPHAYTYALPFEFYKKDRIRRYGFHGTSHRYVAAKGAEALKKKPEDVNLITVHLGNGCSITAVKGGKSIDTSMGLTPLEGLVMGTRCGDIDPAIVFFLAQMEGMDLAKIDSTLNKKSGLLGVSGVSNDMREVIGAADGGNERAALALEIFAYRVRKYVGAYYAALGRLDGVVFTGGIGENSTRVRKMSLEGLEPMGIALDEEKNADPGKHGPDVSAADSRVRVLVIPTNEELTIARDTVRVAFNGKS